MLSMDGISSVCEPRWSTTRGHQARGGVGARLVAVDPAATRLSPTAGQQRASYNTVRTCRFFGAALAATDIHFRLQICMFRPIRRLATRNM
jgi:hypothetical protein